MPIFPGDHFMLHHDAEAQLAALLMLHARPRPWEHRHPVIAARAARLLRHIPVATFDASGSAEGEIIRTRLDRSSAGMTTRLHEAATVLQLPTTPGQYDQGRDRATQRRQARKALRAGVTWREVEDEVEKRHLLDLAREAERSHPDAEYRAQAPDLEELLLVDLWLVAELDGRPLLLSVTPVDGEWAMLLYFRILESGDVASHTRYLMTGVLAEQLVARGVRYLCDSRTPFRLNAGLRHFSRMVGFRTHRVRVLPGRVPAKVVAPEREDAGSSVSR
ncbi:MAG: hypothetical protein JWR20_427 [Marmoricola sp.]|nr:hypothetical protein [Marmoricola sp.]